MTAKLKQAKKYFESSKRIWEKNRKNGAESAGWIWFAIIGKKRGRKMMRRTKGFHWTMSLRKKSLMGRFCWGFRGNCKRICFTMRKCKGLAWTNCACLGWRRIRRGGFISEHDSRFARLEGVSWFLIWKSKLNLYSFFWI